MFCCCEKVDTKGISEADVELETLVASSHVPEMSISEPPTEAMSSSIRQIPLGEEYEVDIERALELPIGLQFYAESMSETSGIVCDVMEGSYCADDVKKGDRLVAVNGSRESFHDLRRMLKEETHLVLTFKRPKEFTINITKESDLGVHLAMCRDSDFLFIKSFQEEGALPDFNKRRTAGRIRPFDCIIEVNGYRGPCTQMLHIIQQETHLKLRMWRYRAKVEVESAPKGSARGTGAAPKGTGPIGLPSRRVARAGGA